MMDKILLAGFGGQGVMFVGKIITYAGMLNGLNVCWIPSYGPEMRGGTANCSVIVSDEEIHSPVIEYADSGIVLNQPSYEKFMPRIKKGGVLIANSSIIDTSNSRSDIEVISIKAGDIANDLGKAGIANMVCLGALIPKLKLLDISSMQKAIDFVVGNKKPELKELNIKAVSAGIKVY